MAFCAFTPLTVRREFAVVPLYSDSGRCYALADPGEAEWLVSAAWFRHRRTGYASRVKSDRSLSTMHQLLMGPSPPGMVIDHINGNKLDNRRANLRIVSIAENGLNRHRANRNNKSSSYPGVSYIQRAGKWRAQVHWQGRDFHGGYFESEAEAAKAARSLRARLMSRSGAPDHGA